MDLWRDIRSFLPKPARSSTFQDFSFLVRHRRAPDAGCRDALRGPLAHRRRGRTWRTGARWHITREATLGVEATREKGAENGVVVRRPGPLVTGRRQREAALPLGRQTDERRRREWTGGSGYRCPESNPPGHGRTAELCGGGGDGNPGGNSGGCRRRLRSRCGPGRRGCRPVSVGPLFPVCLDMGQKHSVDFRFVPVPCDRRPTFHQPEQPGGHRRAPERCRDGRRPCASSPAWRKRAI